jgi:stearoyl-CoA desaturase (delta-9 desaturase)
MDPHSPRESIAWAHYLWVFYDVRGLSTFTERSRLVRDLNADPFLSWLGRRTLLLNASVFILTTALLVAFRPASSVGDLLWLFPVRLVLVWHLTLSVASLAHISGYRNFDTLDDSRNNWLLSILTLGDGWHNNHHAQPWSAKFGVRWFELDPIYLSLRAMRFLGLVKRIRIHSGTSRARLMNRQRPDARGSVPVENRFGVARTTHARLKEQQ